jgi:hypothetical protein
MNGTPANRSGHRKHARPVEADSSHAADRANGQDAAGCRHFRGNSLCADSQSVSAGTCPGVRCQFGPSWGPELRRIATIAPGGSGLGHARPSDPRNRRMKKGSRSPPGPRRASGLFRGPPLTGGCGKGPAAFLFADAGTLPVRTRVRGGALGDVRQVAALPTWPASAATGAARLLQAATAMSSRSGRSYRGVRCRSAACCRPPRR